jgi:hypothetical protein
LRIAYVWNIDWQGSGTALVPNSVTTIRFAAQFFLNACVCSMRRWYVTFPWLISNLESEQKIFYFH